MGKQLKYMHFCLRLLKYTTLIDLEEHSGILFKIWMFTWRFLSCFVLIYTVVFSIVDLYLKRNSDFLELTPTLLNISVYISVASRVIMFYPCKEKTTKLIKLMFQTFKYTTDTQLDNKTMLDYNKRANIGGFIWFMIANLGAQTYIFSPVLTTGNGALPMRLWRPYDPSTTPNYQLTYFFEFFCQLVLVGHMTTTDIFWSTMAYTTSGQFELLAWEFEHVLYTPLAAFNISKDTILNFKKSLPLNFSRSSSCDVKSYLQIREIMQSELYNTQTVQNFKRIVKAHTDLLRFMDEMEKYWSFKLLPMIVMAQSYLTFMIFIMLTSSEITTTVQTLEYVTPIMMQICITSAAGEQLSEQSRKLQGAIFGTPWYFCGKTCSTLVKMVQMRTDREVFITIGGFAPVNLRSLTWLMRSAFSYLAVLRETE